MTYQRSTWRTFPLDQKMLKRAFDNLQAALDRGRDISCHVEASAVQYVDSGWLQQAPDGGIVFTFSVAPNRVLLGTPVFAEVHEVHNVDPG